MTLGIPEFVMAVLGFAGTELNNIVHHRQAVTDEMNRDRHELCFPADKSMVRYCDPLIMYVTPVRKKETLPDAPIRNQTGPDPAISPPSI